ncbi:Hint domain-containing protein [Roseovarius sp.]|uniref:Hint domain-containing protein n=1 Tax=Roseovarius sp. TaxID=1486281 RepID=UPI000C4FCD7C|nr:Hint domain-containing protein [Roseovarius sp.]MAO26590.1 hemolysin [Roseovarius sp.]MAZ23048.1 hemolysin [Roseovarius sp.]
MAIGEAGTIVTGSPTENAPITVTLTEPLTNPVFALTATDNGGDQFTLRVIDETLDADGNTTAFTFIIEEWEYHDGPHPATETINWLAIEEGVHTLPDGRVIEAGTTSANHTNSAVSLTGSFTQPPVVLTSVMSNNDTTTVDSDPLNITSSGFNVRLQEEEGQDGSHAFEDVGWIAIQPGGSAASGTANTFTNLNDTTKTYSLGDTFTNAVVLGETQTINGRDPGTVVMSNPTNSNVGLKFEEEQSGDAELGHVNETVGVVAFENGLIPCLVAGSLVRTPEGERRVETLREGDAVSLWQGGTAVLRKMLLRRLSRTDLAAAPHLRPIRVTAGALGLDLPERDLLVSPQHRFVINSPVVKRMFGEEEVFVPALRLTALHGIYVVTDEDELSALDYVHLVFDRHEVIIAEGAPTESFYPGPQALRAMSRDMRDEFTTLFPCIAEGILPYPPARPVPEARRQKALIRRMAKNRQSALAALSLIGFAGGRSGRSAGLSPLRRVSELH